MHTGKIKELVRERGFGLIGTLFADLGVEQAVEFGVENSNKGPRAVNVRAVPKG